MEHYFDDGASHLQPASRRIFHLPVPISPIPHPWRVVVVVVVRAKGDRSVRAKGE
jgi:hypothetical protein